MNKQGMCDNHDIGDSVNNEGEWSEITENEGVASVNASDRTRSEYMW